MSVLNTERALLSFRYIRRRHSRSFSIIVAVLILAITSISYAALNHSIQIPSSGTITVKTVGITAYWDENCTDEVLEIRWGDIYSGTTKSCITHLRNEGNVPIVLSLNSSEWSPSNAEKYIGLDWDYNGTKIHPTQSIKVELILSVSSNISGITSFSFQIIITGIET